ncbi:MAG: YdeI/OmpD-associated family protein [Bacteroidetes bacterium]|nr:YdeI/OmpD-associated family protein [Bacteroidota bacterium]
MLDDVKFDRMNCYPVKEGSFIVVLNNQIRKKLGKEEGAPVIVKFEMDTVGVEKSKELLACLNQEPEAKKQFESLTMSHQNYFHKWINSAKSADTKAGRIVNTINALLRKMNYGEMIRSLKKELSN